MFGVFTENAEKFIFAEYEEKNFAEYAKKRSPFLAKSFTTRRIFGKNYFSNISKNYKGTVTKILNRRVFMSI